MLARWLRGFVIGVGLLGSGCSETPGQAGASRTECCGCLCAHADWSCSQTTCLDEHGHALGLGPEAGFFELEGGPYVSEGEARNSPRHRIWYAFQPAAESPEDKPLAVVYNGGPGSATLLLFGFNTQRMTLDPDITGAEAIALNTTPWTNFWNLLYIDAPATGFSYVLPMQGGLTPTVGIDLDRDAASFIRVIVRFLARHPALRDNPVVLVGESYGGTRSTLILEHLLHYQRLDSEQALYRDPALFSELVEHFSAVWPKLETLSLGPAEISAQFGAQVLLQPLVAGSTQWDLTTPDTSSCVAGYDMLQCDEPLGWFEERISAAADRMTTIATLSQALAVDPTTIAWMYAAERTEAYGKTEGFIADPSELTSVFGELGTWDNYYMSDNREVREGYEIDSRWWDDPKLGESFLDSAFYVRTFISDARLDAFVWSPAIPPALGAYTGMITSSMHDTEPRAGVERPGWILLDYRSGTSLTPARREIRFPHYANGGHGVTLRARSELFADLSAWTGN